MCCTQAAPGFSSHDIRHIEDPAVPKAHFSSSTNFKSSRKKNLEVVNRYTLMSLYRKPTDIKKNHLNIECSEGIHHLIMSLNNDSYINFAKCIHPNTNLIYT
ncbi:hypothetical protein T265_00677 [Opisthorchis viverrini]|uniref:Uncharacterized protein n=1 Tax=Opisthorchis viverrini TaxID=6198 RepID=A0A075AJL2_OPIVI|nr:hypothetical protein T265_00677 [Opisthorchis viverrini]KER33579.1 hypothetical protein T265_00677 [Opisthorchis viverrini]